MAGQTPAEQVAADMLYETAKDLKGNLDSLLKHADAAANDPAAEKPAGAKLPWALALRVEQMLRGAPDPRDASAALTYGQLQLFHALTQVRRPRAARTGTPAAAVAHSMDSVPALRPWDTPCRCALHAERCPCSAPLGHRRRCGRCARLLSAVPVLRP